MADFLNLPVGGRPAGLAGAYTAVAEGADAMAYNLAGLASVDRAEVTFAQSNYIEKISQQWGALALPIHRIGTFGVGVNYLGIGGIDGYDASGTPTNNVSSHDLALNVGYGRTILNLDSLGLLSLDGGLAVKYIEERLDTVQGDTLAADFGLMARPAAAKWFKFGMSFENLGGSMRFINEENALPLKIKLGGSAQGDWRGLKGLLDIETIKDCNGGQSMALGVEGTVLRALALRFGYETHRDMGQGINFGAGFQMDRLIPDLPGLRIDYAYAGYANFGNTHRFGLTFAFGPQGGWRAPGGVPGVKKP